MFNTVIDTIGVLLGVIRYEFKSLMSRDLSLHRKNKRALVFAPRLPPYVSGGVYRPISWAKYAGENGWKVDFITVKTPPPYLPAGLHLKDQIPSNCEIHYVDKPCVNPSWRFSPRVDGDFPTALKAAGIALSKYSEMPPDVVVCTGPSFDFFVAGYYVSKILKVPLVLDYRDEWTQNPFSFVKAGNIDGFWEKRCLSHADKVIFTTPTMMEHQIDVFGLDPSRSSVVYNGWELEEHTDNDEKQFEESFGKQGSSVSLMYCGMLTDATLPGPFLNDLALVVSNKESGLGAHEIRLHFVGKKSKTAQNQLSAFPAPEMIDLEEFLPRNLAHERMLLADALLLFTDESMSRYIPGKLFDYLASGKPIIVHGVYGEAAKIVESLESGCFVSAGDYVMLGKAIEKIRENPSLWCGGDLRESWLMKHTRQVQATNFFNTIERV